MEVRISVRSLVEFILRSGDIDNRKAASPENAMQEGGRIHRMIQRRMGPSYQAEVSLSHAYDAGAYAIVVEGRADGIITEYVREALPQTAIEEKSDGSPETRPAVRPGQEQSVQKLTVTIDEIKGTYHDLKKMKGPVPVHLAQAKCYAYMYATQKKLSDIRVRMTYCHIETEEIRYFHEEYLYEELQAWFEELMGQYRKWADYQFAWQKGRQESIKKMEFPFPYREGQKELATYVYQTIYHKRKLFIEAPTGAGKTISTVFPALKAMGEGLCERLFYLTAKTITRTVADDTITLLRERGLQLKSVILTAKDKICFMRRPASGNLPLAQQADSAVGGERRGFARLDGPECNPVNCPYAKGHYDRVNEAMYDLLTHADSFTRERIEAYAEKHQVCPFEMCLDMSLFADAVICDYNYLFDPHVYLRRFFAEGVRGEYIFLVDEAHNLVERGREMYSALLCKETFLELKKTVKAYDERIAKNLDKCNREMLALKRECEGFQVVEETDALVRALMRLGAAIEDYLEDHEDSPVRADVLSFYFEVSHFLEMYELADENYVTYSELREDGSFIVKLFCVNPAGNLRDCMRRGRSTILFSATLLPIQYYKTLLGAEEGDYEVYARSVFRPEKLGLYIGSDVTSRYTRRGEAEYYRIAAYIHNIIEKRQGNYMVFFPSHSFLQRVFEIYRDYFNGEGAVECILQESHMNEEAREAFLNRFRGNEACDLRSLIQMDIEMEEERSLLGFCVLGGIFSEGIDLKNDSLIGAIIVGTGLPQVCNERELLKKRFDGWGENGFDYAYRYPGINKVLQAAGRVIRTVDDFGVVALLDERFLSPAYQRLFPREWQERVVVTVDQIGRKVERFWDEWL
ncbi:MAG: ATP-dependent DNA helicase [Lachnospiraceae bacterium]|nr:ATP-dependent DNA helicase [Lachnospiraceae bacterium]